MCLFDSSPRWSRTLRAATLLADALGDKLVVDPGASRRWPLRGRLERSRDMARAVGAEILVTGSAQTMFGRLIAPHRSPALAAATGLATLLVPAQADESLGARRPVGTALVCGVDESPAAEAAVDVAGRLSAHLGLRLHLLHAYAPALPALIAPAPVAVAPVPSREIERAAREAGWGLLERVGRSVDRRALLRLRPGPAAPCIEAYADLFDAPLIVTGAPRHGALASALVGSVAWRLTSRCNRPVMLVPEARADGELANTTEDPLR
jgi:nucleotide-binding universal stress UspA family protein